MYKMLSKIFNFNLKTIISINYRQKCQFSIRNNIMCHPKLMESTISVKEVLNEETRGHHFNSA